MSDDIIEIGISAAGWPAAAAEIESSVRKIEDTLGRSKGALELGKIDPTGYQQWAAGFQRIINELKTEISGLEQGTGRAAAARQATQAAASRATDLTSQLRSQLPETLRAADFSGVVREEIVRAGQQAYGRGGNRAISGLNSPDLGLLQQQAFNVQADIAQRSAARGSKALEQLTAAGYQFDESPDAKKSLQTQANEAIKEMIEHIRKYGGSLDAAAVDTAKAAKEVERLAASQARYEANLDLQNALRGGTARDLKGGLFALDEGTEKQRFVQTSPRGGATPVTEKLAQAEAALLAATEADARALEKKAQADSAAAEKQRAADQKRVDAANKAAQKEEEKTAKLAADNAPRGIGNSFFAGVFGKGFGANSEGPDGPQRGLENLAATAGTTAKYTLLYQALNQVQGVISDTFTEAQKLSEGVRDLDIAMGDAGPATQGYINQLADISRVSGESPSAALEAAARGVRAFATTTGPNADSPDVIQRSGLAIAQSATEISVLTGKQLTDATGDVIAIASAFGLAAEQSQQVVDVLATARSLGGDPGQTSQGLANVAVAAKEAGLSLQQAGNAVSLISARVDESGNAAATRVSRILSILGGTTGQGIVSAINTATGAQVVDPNGSGADKLQQIAAAYLQAQADGNKKLEGLIISKLGGTANSRELLTIFNNASAIFDTPTQTGAGQAQYESRLQTLDGLLKKITGDITNIQNDLVSTDLFAPIGVGLLVLETGLHTLDEFIRLYSQLVTLGGNADWLKPLVTGGLLLAGVSKALPIAKTAFQGSTAVSGLKDLTGITAVQASRAETSAAAATVAEGGAQIATAEETVAVGVKSAGAVLVAELRAAAVQIGGARVGSGLGSELAGGFGTARSAVSEAGGLRGAASSALGLVGGPLGAAAIGGVIGVTIAQAIKSDFDELTSIATSAQQAVVKAANSGDLSGAATALRTASASTSQGGGFLGFATASARSSQANLESQQAILVDGYAKAAEAEQKHNAKLQQGNALGDLATQSVESFNASLQALTASGETAASTAVLLSQALADLLLPTQRKLNAAKISGELGTAALGSVDTLGADINFKAAQGKDFNSIGERIAGFDTGRLVDPAAVKALTDKVSSGLSANGGKALSSSDTTKLAQSAADAYIQKLGLSDVDQSSIDQLRRNTTLFILNNLRANGATVAPADTVLDAAVATQYAQTANQLAGNSAGAAQSNAGRVKAYQTAVSQIAGIRAKADDANLPALVEQAATAEKNLLDAQIKNSEDLIQALAARDPAAAKAKSNKDFKSYIDRALADGNIDAVVNLMKQSSAAQDAAVKATLENNVKLAQAALAAAGNNPNLSGRQRADVEGPARAALAAAQGKLDNFNQAAAYDDGTGAGFGLSGSKSSSDTPGQIANARRDALAVRQGDAAVASAALKDAKTTLAEEAAKGTNSVAYWNDVKAVKEAENALRTAQSGVNAARAEALNADKGDVAQAIGSLVAAQTAVADAAANSGTNSVAYWNAVKAEGQAEDALRTAQAGVETARRDALASKSRSAIVSSRTALQDAKQAMQLALANDGPNSAAYWNSVKQYNDAVKSYQDAITAAAQAATGINAAKVGGGIAAAGGALASAKLALKAAGDDATAKAQAWIQFYNAERQVRDALLAYNSTLGQLGIDLTDPLAVAQQALKDSKAKLLSDQKAGQAPDVLATDKLDVKNKQNQEEAAAFSQRLSDAQIAEQLGRTSHQAYLQYLQGEHDRLTAINGKTRQQIDELNQIDQAIKAAVTSMNGQFNLGDIKVPTVYQARVASVGGYGSSVTSQNVNITVNGADTGMFLQLLNTYFGDGRTSVTATTPRRP